uniref:GAG-pre-integrase domain-containing protein n=1 Tax=Cajanus cajan TaxID=3821 RepID=A0A151SEE5_CAJCA|nr:hypothetical protein KK1_024961 [Cajanus cajan]
MAGIVFFTHDFYLTNALYIPNITFNLIFAPKLNLDLQCTLLVTDSECILQDNHSLKKVGIAKLKNGLYTLNENANRTSEYPCINLFPTNNSDMWHMRMGHPP